MIPLDGVWKTELNTRQDGGSKMRGIIVTLLGQRCRNEADVTGKVIECLTYMGGSKVYKGPKVIIGTVWFRRLKGNHHSVIWAVPSQ